jgi:hypothetical protein
MHEVASTFTLAYSAQNCKGEEAIYNEIKELNNMTWEARDG